MASPELYDSCNMVSQSRVDGLGGAKCIEIGLIDASNGVKMHFCRAWSEAAMPSENGFNVVVAHDYLTQRGGAERVALEIAKAVNAKEVTTALYAQNQTFPEFSQIEIRPSLLNWVGIFRHDPRRAVLLLPFSWSLREPVSADAVICSSSGWAHGIRKSPRTVKIVYCHNPARWLYQSKDYMLDQPFAIRWLLALARPLFIYWDKFAAASADVYIANSTSVAKRIFEAYGREAHVLFPPISIDPTLPLEPVEGLKHPFFLMVGRPRGYKGMQPLVDAFRDLPEHNLVVTGGGTVEDAPSNITSTGYVTDGQLRWLYTHATALISVSREDFGLTPIEANAFGTPTLLLRAGGFLDSTVEGVSGLFIDELTPESIRKAVRSFPTDWDREAIQQHATKFHSSLFHSKIRAIVNSAIRLKRENFLNLTLQSQE